MIFYGWKEKVVHAAPVPHTCTQCASAKLAAVVLQRYFHVYWIPLFPLGKRTITVCNSCQAKKEKKASTQDVVISLEAVQKSAKFPYWAFSGVAVVALILGIGSIIRNQEQKQTGAFVASPHVGDVLLVKTKEAGTMDHTLLKIVNIEENDIALIPGRYSFNFFGGEKQLREKTYQKEADYFVNQTIHVHALSELDVVKVERN